MKNFFQLSLKPHMSLRFRKVSLPFADRAAAAAVAGAGIQTVFQKIAHTDIYKQHNDCQCYKTPKIHRFILLRPNHNKYDHNVN